MSSNAIAAGRRRRDGLREREAAALRRLEAAAHAEAAELARESWLKTLLEGRMDVWRWAERALAELPSPEAAGDETSWWGRAGGWTLGEREEAALRRLATLMCLEGADLGRQSSRGRRLEGYGVRLLLETAPADRPPRQPW